MQAISSLEAEARETHSDATDETTCPECDGQLRADGDEVLCSDCGLVVDDEQIDHGPEWRAFTHTEQWERSRTGQPRTERLHDRGLGGKIGFDDDGVADREQFNRMRFQQRISDTKRERNLASLLGDIQRICDRISASDELTERACRIGREGHGADLVRGNSLEALAVAAVIAAIRETGLPIPMKEVKQYADLGPQGDAYHMLKKVYNACGIQPTIVEPVEHVARICSELDLGRETQTFARKIALAVQDEELHIGSNPASIAGAAVYAAGVFTNSHRTQMDVGDAAEVTGTTVRNQFKRLGEAGVFEAVRSDGE